MNRDTWIGIAGAVVLVTAMVGVFYYERSVAEASGVGAPAPDADPVEGPTLTGTVNVGSTDVQVANVTATSASNVTFRLTWQATNGKDTLKITVAPPTGSGIMEGVVSEPSDAGEIVVSVPVPAGASPEGGWEVTVEFVRADPSPLPGGIPPPTPPPGSTDASVRYTVAVRIA